MGCGASRFDAPCCKAKTTRINPRLHHRIEQLKRRRLARSLKKLTPSKKVLLRHHSDVEDVGDIISHFTPLSEELQKSTHSREDIESCVTSEDSKKPSEKIQDLTVKLNEKNATFKGAFEGNVGDEKLEKVENQSDNAEDGDEEEDGWSGDEIDHERRIGNNDGFFPGSPSFRIYYIESVDDNKKDQRDNENQQLKESTYDTRNTAQIEVAESLKDPTTMIEKKGQKRRGFANAVMGRKIRCCLAS